MRKRIERIFLKTVSITLIACFSICNIAYAGPLHGGSAAYNLAVKTLFSDPEAMIKVFIAWAGHGGLEKKFGSNSIGLAETFIGNIRGHAPKASLRLMKELKNVPNGARHGQVFIVSGDQMLRFFVPDNSPAFPSDKFDIITEKRINEYLVFQALKLKNVALISPDKNIKKTIPGGHVLHAFDIVLKKFPDRFINKENFWTERTSYGENMSRDTTDKELRIMFKLGLIGYTRPSSRSHVKEYTLRNAFKNADMGFINKIKVVLSGLYAEPNDDELTQARMRIEEIITEHGINETAQAVINTFPEKKYLEMLEKVLTYWPDGELTGFDRERIKAILNTDSKGYGRMGYFNWVLGLIHKREIINGKVFVGDIAQNLLIRKDMEYATPKKFISLSGELKDGYKMSTLSVDDIEEIMYILGALPDDIAWISGMFMGQWGLYYRKYGYEWLGNEEEKNNIMNNDIETFFSSFGTHMRHKLEDEYTSMCERSLDVVFEDFIDRLWPRSSEEEFKRSNRTYMHEWRRASNIFKKIRQDKSRKKEPGSKNLIRAYDYFLAGMLAPAKECTKKILLRFPDDPDACDLMGKIKELMPLKKKRDIMRKFAVWDMFFRKGMSVNRINARTGIGSDSIRKLIESLGAGFYRVLPLVIRNRMMEEDIEKLTVFYRGKRTLMFRGDKWRDIMKELKIRKYILRNSEDLSLDRDGNIELSDMFYERFGKVKAIVFVENPDKDIVEIRQHPVLYEYDGRYDPGNIRGKGDILNALDTILSFDGLLDKPFTRAEFMEKRFKKGKAKFSYTRISDELEYLVKLDLLKRNDSAGRYIYTATNKLKGIKAKGRFVISKLPPDPTDEQINDARALMKEENLPVSFTRSEYGKVRGRVDVLLYYLSNFPKYNLKLIKLYTERRALKESSEKEDKALKENRASLEALREVIKKEIEDFTDSGGQEELKITFGRDYAREIREKVEQALGSIDEDNEPSACALLTSALSLMSEEYMMITSSGERPERKKSVWYNKKERVYEIRQWHYTKTALRDHRTLYKKIPGVHRFKVLWKAFRSEDIKLDNILNNLDRTKKYINDMNALISRLEEYKNTVRSGEPQNEANRTSGKKAEVAKVLADIGNGWSSVFIKEKDIAANASALAMELLNMKEYSSLLEVLRIMRSMAETVRMSQENQVFNITKGALTSLRYRIHERNAYFSGRIDDIVSMLNGGKGYDKNVVEKELLKLANHKEIKKEPEFFRMEAVLRGAINKVKRDDGADSIKWELTKVKRRLRMLDLLNVFMMDFRDAYVEARVNGSGKDAFDGIFREKFTQYLEYAKENNIGRGSPRLIWAWFFLAARWDISMETDDNGSVHDAAEKRTGALFKAIQFLIRALEVNDVAAILKPLSSKGKYANFYGYLSGHMMIHMDTALNFEYSEIIDAVSKDFKLNAKDRQAMIRLFTGFDRVLKEKNIKKDSITAKKDPYRCLDILFDDGNDVFRTGLFSADDYYKVRIKKAYDDGIIPAVLAVVKAELDDMVSIGVLREEREPGAEMYSLDPRFRAPTEDTLSRLRKILSGLPEDIHKDHFTYELLRAKVNGIFAVTAEERYAVRTTEMKYARQTTLFPETAAPSGDTVLLPVKRQKKKFPGVNKGPVKDTSGTPDSYYDEQMTLPIFDEKDKGAKGDIISAFDTLFIPGNAEFRKGTFTRGMFRKKRFNDNTSNNYSYDTIKSELEGLVKLGILDTGRSGKAYFYRIKNKYLRAPPDLYEKIRLILWKLSAMRRRPTDEQFSASKGQLEDAFTGSICNKLNGSVTAFKGLLDIFKEHKKERDITGCFIAGGLADGNMDPQCAHLDIAVRIRNMCEHEWIVIEMNLEREIRYLNKKSPVEFRLRFLPAENNNMPAGERKYATVKSFSDGVNMVSINDGGKTQALLDITGLIGHAETLKDGVLGILYRRASNKQYGPVTVYRKTVKGKNLWQRTVHNILNLMRISSDMMTARKDQMHKKVQASADTDIYPERSADTAKASGKKEKLCVLIDNKLGGGKVADIIKALEKVSRTNNPLLRKLFSVDIMGVDMIPRNIAMIQEKKHVAKKNMLFIAGMNDQKALNAYKDVSVITYVNDTDLTEGYYYPLLEVLRFTLARAGIFDYKQSELYDLYKAIPNMISDMSEKEMDRLFLENTVFIKLGIPAAGAVTDSPEMDKRIAEYIISYA